MKRAWLIQLDCQRNVTWLSVRALRILRILRIDQVQNLLVMDSLPYDVLVALSMRMRVEDINYALRGTSQNFRNVFGEEEYWKNRLQQKWPTFYNLCSRGIVEFCVSLYFAP